MNNDLSIANVTVAELLQSNPSAVRFFLDQKTDCVGCHLARFCTLKDVVSAYHLNEHTFTEALDRIQIQTPQRRIL